MKRRVALKLITAGVLAEHLQTAHSQLVAIAQTPAAYQLQFFSPERNELLDRLTDMMIPTDDQSPGASAANVSLFIDLIVFHSGRVVQRAWTDGLQAVENDANKHFHKPFLECSSSQQDRVMAAMAANEGQPITELESFFRRLKEMTINGYYTSHIGIHQDLHYKGNTPRPEYIGCTHPDHSA